MGAVSWGLKGRKVLGEGSFQGFSCSVKGALHHLRLAAAFSLEGIVEPAAERADVFGRASQDVAVAGFVVSDEYAGGAGAAYGKEIDELTGSSGIQILFEKYDIFRTPRGQRRLFAESGLFLAAGSGR